MTRPRLSWLVLLGVLAGACGDDDGGSPPADGGGGDGGGAMDSGADGGARDTGPSPGDGGGVGEGGGEGGIPMGGSSSISHECAPDDGPALRIVVSRAGGRCMPDTTQEHLRFFVYDGLPIEAPETVMIAAASAAAELCPGETSDAGMGGTEDGGVSDGGAGGCMAATSGSITFETFTDDMVATGTFSIMVGTQLLEGTFNAVFCGDPPLCG